MCRITEKLRQAKIQASEKKLTGKIQEKLPSISVYVDDGNLEN